MTFESRVRLAMTGKRAPDIDVTSITKTDAMRRLVNRWSPPPLPQLLVSSELVPVGDATADDATGMSADVVDMIRGPYRLFSFSLSFTRPRSSFSTVATTMATTTTKIRMAKE